MPIFSQNEETRTLEITSPGNLRCNGAWKKAIPVVAGSFYRFHAEYLAQDITHPRRSVLARVYWRDEKGKQVSWPEYPRLLDPEVNGWRTLENTFKVPVSAAVADLELIFRWDEKGKVSWRNISFTPSQRPENRTVKLASINYRHLNSSGPKENRDAYGSLIEEAGKAGVKILCLPEGFTIVGTDKSYLDVAEPVPGPSTEFLGELAKKFQMYIAAGIYESEGETIYNTAVFLGKDGELAGKYRKVSLPREEIEGGLTPGAEFPVFDTVYGKVGILICWDIQFPEGARRLASKGAEIILLPIWGGIEPLFPARAIENQIILVTSSFDSTTGIWDERGEQLAVASENGTLAIAEVDLSEEVYWEWLGNLRSRIPREAPVVQEVENH
jgi:predicted amidohydrolase